MKTENVNNELVLGNKDNTSSHYHINGEKNPVPVGEIVKHCVKLLKQKRYEHQ